MDEYELCSYLNNYKLYFIAHRIGKRVIQDVVVYLLHRNDICPLSLFEKLSDGKTREERFRDIDKAWKNKTIECMWTEWDLKGDITYWHEVIRNHFTYNNLIEEVQALKKYRNKLQHSVAAIVSSETYAEQVKYVRGMFEDIYKKIDEGINSVNYMNIQSRIAEILKQIDEVEDRDLKAYKKEFDKDACNVIIRLSRKEHKENDRRYSISTPCSWMWADNFQGFVVDRIFTPLKQGKKRLDMKYLLKVMSEGTQTIVLSGLAGSGKTTLCRFVSSEWLKTVDRGLDKADSSEEIEDVGEFNILIYFELRSYQRINLSKEENKIFFCLKNCILPKTLGKIMKIDSEGEYGLDEDECMNILQDLKILFIIDGFDEVSEKGELILADIIKHFKKGKIILSTRFEHQHKAENIMKRYGCHHKIVKICGFDEKGLKDFSEKVFTALEPDGIRRKVELDAFLEMMQTKARVLDKYLKLPLTTALLITLWHYHPNERKSLANTKTATELYEVMFKLWQERVQDRLRAKSPTKKIDWRGLLDYLSKIAWIHLKDDELCIGAEHQKNFEGECEKRGITGHEVMSAFFVFEGEVFSFMHKTIMEYLAACHLVSIMVKKENCVTEFFRHEDKCIKFRELFRYLAGCMARKENGDLLMRQAELLMRIIDRADIDNTDYTYWYSLVIESKRNYELCREIGYRVKKDVWKLADETVVAGLRVLAFTNPEISCLELMVYENPYEIKEFRESMRLLQENTFKKKKGWLYDKMNPIEVKLVLRYCVTMPGSRDTDEFLRTLFPWGHLTYYEGHLGERSGETLSYCFKLKHMVARVSSVATLKVLSDSLKRIRQKKVLRSLHIMLDIGNDTVPDVAMEFNGNLDITIPSSREADIKWIGATVFSLGKGVGCRDLVLKNCDMTRSGVERLVKIIAEKESVHHKLSLYLISELGEKEEMELEHHVRKQYKFFDIEFF